MDYTTTFSSLVLSSTSSGASATVLYTVPSNYDFEVEHLLINNYGTSNQKVSVQIYDSAAAEYKNLSIENTVTANSNEQLVNSNRVYLHGGDKIVGYRDGGTISLSCSGKLTYNPRR